MPSVDQRVVQMIFDNKQFESGVAQSQKSLEQLKKGLDLDKSAASLSTLEKVAKKLDLSGIADGVEEIADKFSMLGMIGVTAMQRVSGAVVDAGAKFVRMTSGVDDVMAGMSKYEMKTKAVQTITNATGKSVDEVNGVLEKLMKYTDETSYDFSTMVSTIGKFTAAGVDLKVAEEAMEGIANEAAKSGAGIQQANSAMYNFAQALSQGSVKLADWKSISIANMSTKEFKEELIKSAIAAGTLTKQGDAVGKILKGTGKKAKATTVDFRTFESTLSDGWLTTEVLLNTLKKYSDTSTQFGLDAFHAAQEALTFTDAMQAVRDALSTSWGNTFEYLFGNLDEARVLWTNVANSLYDLVMIFPNYRNELLKGWHENEGYTKAVEALSNAWEAFMNIVNAVKDAVKDIFPPITSEQLVNATEKVRQATENWKKAFGYITEVEVDESIEKTTDYALQLYDTMKNGMKNSKVQMLQEQLIKAGYSLDKYGADGVYGPETEKAVKELQKALGVEQTGIWDYMTRDAAIAKGAFKETTKDVKTTTEEIDNTTERTKRLQDIVRGFSAAVDIAGRSIKFVFDIGRHILSLFSPLGDSILNVVAFLSRLTVAWRNDIVENQKFEKSLDKVKTFLKPFGDFIKGVADKINAFLKEYEWVDSFSELFDVLITEFRTIPVVATYWDKVAPVAKKVKEFFKVVKEAITGFFTADTSGDDTMAEKLKSRLEPLNKIWEWMSNNFVNPFKKAESGEGSPVNILDQFVKGIAKIIDFVKNLDLGQITMLGVSLFGVFKLFKLISGPAKFISNFAELPKSLNKAIKGYGFTKSMDNAGSAIKSMGEGIALLAASIVVISMLDPKKAWNAVGIVASLAGVLLLVALAFDKLKIGFDKKKVKGIISFSIGMLLLSKAVSILGQMTGNDLLKGLVGIGILLTEIGLFSKLVTKNAKEASTLDAFIKVGTGIMQLAQSMMWIAALSWEEIAKALVTMAGLMLELALFMKLTNGKEFQTGPLKMAGIGAAVFMLALSLKNLGKLSWSEILKGLVGLGAVLFELGLFMKLVDGKKAGTGMLGMIGIGVAVALLAKSLIGIAQLSWGGIAKGLAGLGLVMTELSVFMYAIAGRRPGRQIALALAMVGIGLALSLFASSLKGIGKMKTSSLIKGIAGLGILFLEIAAFMKLIGGRNGLNMLGNAASLIGIGVALNLIVLSLKGLSSINAGDMLKSITALGTLFLELSVFMKLTSGIESGISVLPVMIAIGASLLTFGLVLKTVADIPWSTIAAFGISFGVAMNGIAAAMGTLGHLPTSSALTAVANLDIFIANLVAVLAALNGLNELTSGGLAEWLEGGAQVLGNAIGGFIKGIFEPFRENRGSSSDQSLADFFNGMVSDLSTTMDNLQPVLAKAENITKAQVTGFENLVSVLALMSGEQILDSLSGFLSGSETGSGYVEFAKNLVLVVPYLQEFSEKATGIKESNMQAAAAALGYFKDVAAATIPMTAAEILSAISAFVPGAGDSPFISFAAKLVDLLPSVKQFADSAVGINSENIEAAGTAMTAFGEVCTEASKIGWAGFISNIGEFITGQDNVTSFTDKMIALVPKLKTFGEQASGIDNSSIQNSADSLSALANVANEIPGALGIVQAIFGEHDVGEFGSDLEKLGDGLYSFYDATKDIPAEYSADGYVNALKGLAGVGEALPGAGGFIQSIKGEKDLESFGDDLKPLGEGLAAFAIATNDIPSDYNIDGPVSAMNALADLESELESKGGLKEWILGEKSLATFGEEIASLGDDLATFSDSIKSVNASKVKSVGVALQEMGTAMSHVPDEMTVSQSVAAYAYGFSSMMREGGLVDSFVDTGSKLDEYVGKGILQNSRTAISNMQTVVSHVGLSIRSYYNAFVNAGSYLTAGLGQGIYNGGKTVIGTARMLANSVRNIIGSIWKINSPSRVGYWLGEMWDAGIANGISDYASSVTSVSGDMADSTVKAAEYGLSTFSQSLIDDTNMTPVIRPVLDLSEVQAGANGIGGYFGNHTIGIGSTNLANRISSKDAVNRQAAEAGSNANLGMTIMNLNERINQLDDTISNMKVVMDSGALVGQIGPGMDRYLGRRQIMSRRGS